MPVTSLNDEGYMSRMSKTVLIAALAMAAWSCGTSSTLVQRWSEPGYTGTKGQKVMVVALAKSEGTRRVWEEAFSHALVQVKAQPIAGSSVFTNGLPSDEATLKQTIRESGADLVAVTRLVDVDKEQVYVPGTTYYPAPYYGMYGYYNNAYGMMNTPGYYQENKVYKLETNVYDVKTEKLVWNGLTETVNPETAQDAANSIINVVVLDMIEHKIIGK
jgi:hypothetical protein